MSTETVHAITAGNHYISHQLSEEFGRHVVVLTFGDVVISDETGNVYLTVRGQDVTTSIALPITREQLCDLACGIWIEEMAEADQ